MKKKIMLVGDSWFAGCWNMNNKLYHSGIAAFLRKKGNIVKNVAHGGNTNRVSIYKLLEYVEKHGNQSIEDFHILLVVTDPLREFDTLCDDNIRTISNSVCDQVTTKNELIQRHDEQRQLDMEYFNDVAEELESRFILFGGLCELKPEHIKGYDNLELGLGSWQKFMDPTLNTPIVSRGSWQYLISHESQPCLVELAEEVHNFYWNVVRNHPDFQPDGSHPSIESHRVLANYIDDLLEKKLTEK